MKIVHVTRRFVKEEWGGVETVVLELSKQLVSKGIGAEIVLDNICPKGAGGLPLCYVSFVLCVSIFILYKVVYGRIKKSHQ